MSAPVTSASSPSFLLRFLSCLLFPGPPLVLMLDAVAAEACMSTAWTTSSAPAMEDSPAACFFFFFFFLLLPESSSIRASSSSTHSTLSRPRRTSASCAR